MLLTWRAVDEVSDQVWESAHVSCVRVRAENGGGSLVSLRLEFLESGDVVRVHVGQARYHNLQPNAVRVVGVAAQ